MVLSLLMAACGGGSSTTPSAPGNFVVTPGDGKVVLTWDAQPGQIYAVYYKVGSSVTVGDYDNLIVPITSPYTVSNLANQTQYAFILNATAEGGVPGPATPVVTTVPGATGAGIAWTIGTPLSTSALRGVAFGQNIFVAVGVAATVFTAASSNTNTGGVTSWSSATSLPITAATTLSSVIFDGTRFVALGVDGSIITSTDTLAWESGANVNSGAAMNAIAYGRGTYVAVGDGGAIASNTTANVAGAWLAQTSGTAKDLYGVAFAGGVFIAVGADGTLLTSPDGVTWTARTSKTVHSLWSVAFGANTYVAVGDAGTVVTSSDGATWTAQTSLGPQDMYAICFGTNTTFVAVGAAGTAAYSTTGAEGSWTVGNAGSSDLFGIAPGGVLMAVGVSGANVSGK